LNEISIEDFIEIEVNKYGVSQQSITYYLYLPQSIDVLDFSSKKIETSFLAESSKTSTLKSFTLKDDHLFNDEQLSGMSKITLGKGEISKLHTNFKLVNDDVEKQLNSFLIVIEFNSENPEQLNTVISSANFDKQNYPNEARHRWLIRCSPDYSIKLNVTDFQIEKNSDEILLYDATLSGSNLVGEITSLGEIETSTSELMVSFKSDCEVTNKGFEAFVQFVEKSSDSNKKLKTISEPEITENLETTTAITTTNYPTTTTTLAQKSDHIETKQYAYEIIRTTSSQESTTEATSITKSHVVETTTKQSNATIDNINDFYPEAKVESANFTYFITPRFGNWSESQRMCEEQGGSLISESLKPELGLKNEVLDFLKTNRESINEKNLWIGIRKMENNWQLLDGTSYENWVLNWHPNQPNSNSRGIVCVHVIVNRTDLNDYNCNKSYLNYYKGKAYMYGLCEKTI